VEYARFTFANNGRFDDSNNRQPSTIDSYRRPTNRPIDFKRPWKVLGKNKRKKCIRRTIITFIVRCPLLPNYKFYRDGVGENSDGCGALPNPRLSPRRPLVHRRLIRTRLTNEFRRSQRYVRARVCVYALEGEGIG